METCIYKNEMICAYDVRLPNNVLNWELRKEWRRAAEEGFLKCECCNQEVELRAGSQRIPYFAHKRGALDYCDWDIEYRGESEEHKKGRYLLFRYFRNKYQYNCVIVPKQRFEGNRRVDIYVKLDDEKELVVEFQRNHLTLADWEKRHSFYNEKGIKDYWFMAGAESDLQKIKDIFDMNFFEQLMINEVNDKMAIYLNVESEMVYAFKRMVFVKENKPIFEELFRISTPLDKVTINHEGITIPNFEEEYKANLMDFNMKCEEKMKKSSESKKDLKEREVTNNKYPLRKNGGYAFISGNSSWYIRHVKNAIIGDKSAINKIAKGMNRCPDDFHLIKQLFKTEHDNGNIHAKNTYIDITKRAGMYMVGDENQF